MIANRFAIAFALSAFLVACGGGGDAAPAANPPPGTPYAAFGTGGKVLTDFASDYDVAYALAILPDGKILVAGEVYTGAPCCDFGVARYNADGTLDTSFGTDGKVITAMGGEAHARAIAAQADGKIVVAGYATNGTNMDFALVRYNADGSLDTSFDTDGIVKTQIGGGNDVINAIAIQADGKIVVAGQVINGTNYDFALARYTTDGALDTSFDVDGRVITPVGTSNSAEARAIAIQSDGKIVVAGAAYVTSSLDFALARYNTDGSLDTTFDVDGMVTTPIGGNTDYATAVAIQSDGKIVAAGYSANGTDNDFSLARYYSDGSLDTTFDVDGKVITSITGGYDYAQAVALQTDGKIVVAGYYESGAVTEAALARYTAGGGLDTSFGTDGELITALGSSDSYLRAVAIRADGKIVVAGESNGGASTDFALAVFWP